MGVILSLCGSEFLGDIEHQHIVRKSCIPGIARSGRCRLLLVGYALLTIPEHRYGRVSTERPRLVAHHHTRLDGDRVARTTKSIAASHQIPDGHTLDATGQAKGEMMLRPRNELEARTPHVAIRDRHRRFEWVRAKCGHTILLLRRDGVGAIHKCGPSRDEIVVAIQVEQDSPSAVARLDGLIHRSFLRHNVGTLKNLKRIHRSLLPCGHIKTQTHQHIGLAWFSGVKKPHVPIEANVPHARSLGVDDQISWLLIPFLGFTMAGCALNAIVYGLMSAESWNARLNPTAPADSPQGETGRWTVAGLITALFLGTTVLMASLAFTFQRYFEYQAEAAHTPALTIKKSAD